LSQINYKSIPLNTIPSPEDKRDYPISKLVAQVNVFPDQFEIPYNNKIKNQGNVCSCVGHSLSYCREITEEKQNKKFFEFSPGFIYANRELNHYQGEGMIPREALESVKKYGCVVQSVFPFNDDYSALKNKFISKKDYLLKYAYPYRISSYCRLYTTNEIKNALMQLGAVTICVPIYESFYNTISNGVVSIPKSNEKLYGYHEMTITGWRKDNKWITLNSWGGNWGNRGRCYLDFKFPIVEAWSITDDILPHPEPEPEKQKYWRVQLGAFKNKSNCEKYQKKIFNETGWKSYIVFIDGFYKLQMNCFINKTNAQNFSKQLKSMGYNNFIVFY